MQLPSVVVRVKEYAVSLARLEWSRMLHFGGCDVGSHLEDLGLDSRITCFRSAWTSLGSYRKSDYRGSPGCKVTNPRAVRWGVAMGVLKRGPFPYQ